MTGEIPLYLDGDTPGLSDDMYSDLYAREETRHYLYWGRRQALLSLLAPFTAPSASPLRVLDIGCGTGYVLTRLAEFGAQAVGLEACAQPLEMARRRGLKHLYGGTAQKLPFADGQFDMALSLDVFEHLEDDIAAMREARRVLAENGILVTFVPAGPALWSRCDEIQGHHRRYRRGELIAHLIQAGFMVERTTFLLPTFYFPALAIRTANRCLLNEAQGRNAAFKEYSMPPLWLNTLLRGVLWLEAKGLTWWNYPFGITLGVLARRT